MKDHEAFIAGVIAHNNAEAALKQLPDRNKEPVEYVIEVIRLIMEKNPDLKARGRALWKGNKPIESKPNEIALLADIIEAPSRAQANYIYRRLVEMVGQHDINNIDFGNNIVWDREKAKLYRRPRHYDEKRRGKRK